MRYTACSISLLLVLTTLFCGCKKHSGSSDTVLEGNWMLRETSGGMLPGSVQYPSNNGNILYFRGNKYTIASPNQPNRSGEFSIVEDNSATTNVCLVLPAGQYTSRLIYKDSSSAKIFFQINGNRIRFYSGCYAVDAGHSEVYEKLTIPGVTRP